MKIIGAYLQDPWQDMGVYFNIVSLAKELEMQTVNETASERVSSVNQLQLTRYYEEKVKLGLLT